VALDQTTLVAVPVFLLEAHYDLENVGHPPDYYRALRPKYTRTVVVSGLALEHGRKTLAEKVLDMRLLLIYHVFRFGLDASFPTATTTCGLRAPVRSESMQRNAALSVVMLMNRRKFLASGAAALATAYAYPGLAQWPESVQGFPASELYRVPYIENTPISLGASKCIRNLPRYEVRRSYSLGNLFNMASRRRVLALPADVV
jgi:hypothetical protein